MRDKDLSSNRIVDLWSFRSDKSGKRYIIEVEYFNHHFLGLKFYWKGVESSKQRYSLLTYDYEPRTIVMTCVYVMLEYFQKDKCASFGFVAADDIGSDNSFKPNKRFRFYRAMMLSVFGQKTFAQGYDIRNSIYLLINRQMLNNGTITVNQIEQEITSLYEGEYTVTLY